MNNIVRKNNKYYLDVKIDESKLEYYTKKDILKVEYQKRYRIKKSLLSSPIGTMVAKHVEKNMFKFYYLDNDKVLHGFIKIIDIL